MIPWWGFVLMFLTFLVIIVTLIIVYGFGAWIRYSLIYPEYLAVIVDQYGVRETRPIKTTITGDWKIKTDDPFKVKFNLVPKGIGKPEEREWDDSDYYEIQRTSKKGKIIIFGIKHFRLSVASELHKTKQTKNQLIAEKAITKYDLDFHKHNEFKLAEKLIETGKKGVLLMPTKNTQKKPGA